MPISTRTSSRLMRATAIGIEKPTNHRTKRTTTTVQIKLAINNLREGISCYLIAQLSYYSRWELASTWVVVARTRAWRRLSAAGLARMATAGLRREPQTVSNEKP